MEGFRYPQRGGAKVSGERMVGMRGMNAMKVIGLTVVFALLAIIAVPVAAEEKTIELTIPGCNA
jgi:hypothetical protein